MSSMGACLGALEDIDRDEPMQDAGAPPYVSHGACVGAVDISMGEPLGDDTETDDDVTQESNGHRYSFIGTSHGMLYGRGEFGGADEECANGGAYTV